MSQNNQTTENPTIIIATPAEAVSGGPELTHQLCHTLGQLGISAFMYYYDESGAIMDIDAPTVYQKYETGHIADPELLQNPGNILVIPEVAIPLYNAFPTCQKYIWWLSVDNYLSAYQYLIDQATNNNPDVFQLSSDTNLMHLVQSDYARDFLETKMHIAASRIHFLSDYLNSEFFRIRIPDQFKQNYIAYNPKKGYSVLKPIIEANPQFRWMPIIDMTPQDVGNLLRLSKIYLDFGNHPGKDRIPREAAISGCCVITNKKGSAAYEKDVPIPEQYKFENVTENPSALISLIEDIFKNYTEHRKNYTRYCDMILHEEEQFVQDVKNIFLTTKEETL